MEKTLKAAILGAGGRGCGYGKLMQQRGTEFKITAACDINPEQLGRCGKILGLEQAELFSDEEEFWSEKRADVLVIATYDRSHVRQCVRAMKMGYDVLLEKPVSDSREELAELLRVQEETDRKVVVCHELRYGPAFEKLYELLKSGVIGRLIAIDAMERVVYWHQAQAYVRIQSVTNDICHPTILAKCSHDLKGEIRTYPVRASVFSPFLRCGGLFFPHTENVYSAQLGEIVRIEIAHVRVIVMGADVVAALPLRVAYHCQHERMIKSAAFVAELNYVAGEKLREAAFFGERPSAFVCCHEVIEIIHARPGRRFIVCAPVVPAEGGRVVHYAAAGIDRL